MKIWGNKLDKGPMTISPILHLLRCHSGRLSWKLGIYIYWVPPLPARLLSVLGPLPVGTYSQQLEHRVCWACVCSWLYAILKSRIDFRVEKLRSALHTDSTCLLLWFLQSMFPQCWEQESFLSKLFSFFELSKEIIFTIHGGYSKLWLGNSS